MGLEDDTHCALPKEFQRNTLFTNTESDTLLLHLEKHAESEENTGSNL